MTRRMWLLAAIAFAPCLRAEGDCKPQAPCYSEAGVVSAASFVTGALAPDALISIFGTDLSYSTRALGPEDMQGIRLPVQLGGVTVHVGPFQAPLYYVSPTQINVLVPRNLLPGVHDIRVVREGRAGPAVRIGLLDAAPALFLMDPETLVATKADFSLITNDAPAEPGEWVILWATGLGALVSRPGFYDEVPIRATPIERLSEFRVLLDGVEVDPDRIGYAGAAPGYGGLYQINLKLPEVVGDDPEVRIAVGEQVSPVGPKLLVKARHQ